MAQITVTKETNIIVYNLKQDYVQNILDFDYLCRRRPSIVAIVHPGKKGFHKTFFGQKEILIPVVSGIRETQQYGPALLLNLASSRSVGESTLEALPYPWIQGATLLADNVPERVTKKIIACSKNNSKWIIGPATVGAVFPGRLKLGSAGGDSFNTLRCKLYQQGNVGLVSKSGGMLNEMCHLISKTTSGISQALCIGGDRFPGLTILDCLNQFEHDPSVKLIVVLGELGGDQEYQLLSKNWSKPIIIYTIGSAAQLFPWKVQFGHANAAVEKDSESAEQKNKKLKEAGFLVPDTFDEIEPLLRETAKKLGIMPKEHPIPPPLPKDFNQAALEGIIRVPTSITTTVDYDQAGKAAGIGELIGLLWFKKKLPLPVAQLFENILILAADHGAAVAGAHNAIVTARAGKDMVSALCSGLLTIGPRFGGAIDDACRNWYRYVEHGPSRFFEEMKQKQELIPGIGHRVKSKNDPDKRVEELEQFARKHFNTKYLDFAKSVEALTLRKSSKLILNIDGCIAAVFLDALSTCTTTEELQQIVEIGYANGLFVVARSIGIIAHILDQKRLDEPLYRHNERDILKGKSNEY